MPPFCKEETWFTTSNTVILTEKAQLFEFLSKRLPSTLKCILQLKYT